jgi:hypothetical protein
MNNKFTLRRRIRFMIRWGSFGLLAGILMAQAPESKVVPTAPQQPIAYSHKLHVGALKLQCA